MADTNYPPHDNGESPVPPNGTTLEYPPDLKSPSDTASQVTHPSDTAVDAPSSPIGAKDIGIPDMPEQRQFVINDASTFEEGYNSEGQIAPWEGPDLLYPNNLLLFEDHFLVGFPPFSLVRPIFENISQNLHWVPQMLKPKVENIKKELKN